MINFVHCRLQSRYRLMSLSSSQVLQVSATSREPGAAAEHAIAFARAYLKFQGQDAAAVAESYSGLLDNLICGLHEPNSDLGPDQVHNRSCDSFRRPDDTHQVADTEVVAGGRDAIMVTSYPQVLDALENTPMTPVSLLTSPRHADAEAASKKLEAAILGFRPRRERMAISPVRQLIKGK
ncbi:hypothetical protein [Pseudarthrobacter sulfonivorans]|uniref:hypothetical protein n=1 Tax=Pseudarthrobacter sulfonivorans TaxID=121292 RepID=UPI00285E7E1A|nr:hypothetical protein [Pseudarthrobacter sulfonivorans]MDR6413309.1 hypothetical protein [Pseudarthrobacter sulfonivorans]